MMMVKIGCVFNHNGSISDWIAPDPSARKQIRKMTMNEYKLTYLDWDLVL